jgi:hypothetical protein
MHSAPNASRVRFTAPLAPFAAGLVQEFAAPGYAESSAGTQLQFAAHLSGWLAAVRLGPSDLTDEV